MLKELKMKNKLDSIQSKKDSHIEITLNQVVGIIGGWLIVMFVFPFFDYLEQFYVATISSILFFIWSYSRSYIIRRYFNGRLT